MLFLLCLVAFGGGVLSLHVLVFIWNLLDTKMLIHAGCRRLHQDMGCLQLASLRTQWLPQQRREQGSLSLSLQFWLCSAIYATHTLSSLHSFLHYSLSSLFCDGFKDQGSFGEVLKVFMVTMSSNTTLNWLTKHFWTDEGLQLNYQDVVIIWQVLLGHVVCMQRIYLENLYHLLHSV